MIVALLLACVGAKRADDTSTTPIGDDTAPAVDEDADGFPEGEDCDDSDRAVNPLADERCNDVDDDCDKAIDEEAVDQGTWYADTDGDGYGDRDVEVHGCDQPDDSSGIPGDCDDTDPDAYPVAPQGRRRHRPGL
jgi:hypothetical protein